MLASPEIVFRAYVLLLPQLQLSFGFPFYFSRFSYCLFPLVLIAVLSVVFWTSREVAVAFVWVLSFVLTWKLVPESCILLLLIMHMTDSYKAEYGTPPRGTTGRNVFRPCSSCILLSTVQSVIYLVTCINQLTRVHLPEGVCTLVMNWRCTSIWLIGQQVLFTLLSFYRSNAPCIPRLFRVLLHLK